MYPFLGLFAQQIGDSNPSLFDGPAEAATRQIEVPLELYNQYLINAGLDPIGSESLLVTENNTVVISHEIPLINKKKKERVPTSVPAPTKHFLQSKPNYAWEEESLMSGLLIDGVDFNEDANNNGSFTIPPDPHGAVGTSHVCYVLNRSIDCYTKGGNQLAGFSQSLASFFSPLSPENGTFDPKIIWDQYENRFVAVTLIKVGNSISRVLLAVSATADPGGTWYYQAIDARDNGCWFDYPGLAVDDQAIYITGNYFNLNTDFYCESNLIIVDKGVNGGIYDGVTSTNESLATNNDFNLYNPVIEAGAGSNVTLQPTHVFGTLPAGLGAFLVSYSGLTNGADEFIQNFTITNPLSNPTFSQELIFVGNIDNTAAALPEADQPNTSINIATNDRRALNAVWRNDELWVAATVRPSSGANANQATAYWTKLNVDGINPGTLNIQGEVGGEDIESGISTFFPSIAVNSSGNAALSFSASGANTFAGAYATSIDGTTGAVGNSLIVKEGIADYNRRFGGSRNRWGDYTKMSLDPVNEVFWATSMAAISKGTILSGTPQEDGRWQVFVKELTELSPTCPVNLSVNGNPIEGGIYSALNTITSTGRVAANTSVTFEAGQSIVLSPNFRVEKNASFTAQIGSFSECETEQSTQSIEERTAEISTLQENQISIFPNPSRQQTNIALRMDVDAEVVIDLYDLTGKQLLKVLPATYQEKGVLTARLDTDQLNAGIYLLIFRIGDRIETRKLSVVR
ncbi:MAG: T9SS type A sorting domain-containing protein [Bacteroidota bacterium]